MKRFRPAILVVVLAAISATAGCAGQAPYIYRLQEFNRGAADFGKAPANIDSVTICYNKIGTKPEIVANMASAECARYNKKAEFLRQSYEHCPLTTPVAAEYRCVGRN
jgi:hypothetical protein